MKIRMAVTKEMLQANIKCLNIENVRATNALCRNGIFTVGDLVNKIDRLPNFQGVGALTVNLIKNALANFIIENSTDEMLRQMSFEGKGKIKVEGGEAVEI